MVGNGSQLSARKAYIMIFLFSHLWDDLSGNGIMFSLSPSRLSDDLAYNDNRYLDYIAELLSETHIHFQRWTVH